MTERRTDIPSDDLLARLAAADPVDPATLPSPSDPPARQLLENVMYQQPNQPAEAGATTIDPGSARPTGFHRSRGLLVAAAAAVLLLVAGALVFAPDNTPSAVAAVHSAAQTTADADSGRITTTFELTQTGGGDERVAGSFEAEYAGSDIAISLQLDSVPDGMVPGSPELGDARLVDDVLYLNEGGRWLAVDTDGLFGQLIADFVDPRVLFETVQQLTDASEIGTAVIDGVETTHYRSIVDLGDETLTQSGWLAFQGLQIDAEGEVTVDMYVDGDQLRQLDISGDVREAAGDATDGEVGSGTFDISTSFTDIGGDIVIEAPADAEMLDPTEGLFED